MSRKCRVCGNQFRPAFGAQKYCTPCWRLAAGEPDQGKAAERKPDRESIGVREARRALGLRRGPATDDDRPRGVSTFPGPKIPVLPGQLPLIEERGEEMDSSSTTEIVEGEALELTEEPCALAPTLFRTADPRVALARMSELSALLMDVVKQQRLAKRIGGRDHLYVEAWLTLAGMTGLASRIVWTKPNETGDGYLARADVIRIADGAVVGGAEAECARSESAWKSREGFALRAMAQTRATSRALRGPLGMVVTLAGYAGAAVEEMPVDVDAAPAEPAAASTGPIPEELKPTHEQQEEIKQLIEGLQECDPEIDWRQKARGIAGCPWSAMTATIADMLIGKLRSAYVEMEDEEGAA